jgi:peptidyl-prolyl cis-trans isomerase SurA
MWKLWSLSALMLLGTLNNAFAQPTDNMELLDRVVAVLGNEAILFSDLEAQRIENERLGSEAPQLSDCELLEEMLLQKLYLNQAKLDSLEVTDEEIRVEVDRRMTYFIEQVGSIDAFEQFYGKSISEFKDEFYEPVKEQKLIQKMRSQIASATNVTPKDVENFYKSIPKDSLPLIDSEVQYSQIVILPKVKFEEKKATKNFLDSIRTAIINGKTSMSVEASRHSQDPGSKYKGGCYDLIERGTFVQEYEAAVFTTNEGMYSPVFESKFGFHFVYVEERRGEFYKSCHILMKPKITQTDLNRARTSLDSILTAISIDSLTFEKAAIKFSKDEASAKQGGKVVNARSFSTKHPVSSLEPSIFFVLDELEPGEISEPMEYETPEGQKAWRVIRLDSRTNAHKANLKDDYQMIKQYAESIEQQNVMSQWVDSKILDTYLRIDEGYMGCDFGFKWHQQ